MVNNLIKSANESDYLELKTILKLFTGQTTIHSKVSSKYKTQIETWIKCRYPDINNEFKQIWINNVKKRGWFHIKLKKDLSFQLWLDEHIVYKEGSILRLKDVCDLYSKELNNNQKYKIKLEIQKWIKQKYIDINHILQDSSYNNEKFKGWKNLTLEKNDTRSI